MKIETTKCNNNSTLIVPLSSIRENKFCKIQITSILRNMDDTKITCYTVSIYWFYLSVLSMCLNKSDL